MANKFLDENGLLYLWEKITKKFVSKVEGKGLSEKDFTADYEAKLKGLSNYTLPSATPSIKGGVIVGDNLTVDENGRVSATAMDWANVKNKPEIPDSLADLGEDSTHRTVTDAEKAAWGAKSDFTGSYKDLTDKPTIPTKLAELADDSTHRIVTDAQIADWNAKSNFSGSYNDLTDTPTDFAVSDHEHEMGEVVGLESALSNKVDVSQKAQPNGIATLDSTGVIPSTQLPSYVDEVIEGYLFNGTFYEDESHSIAVEASTGKIYLDVETNLSYRYGGTAYVQITSSDLTPIENSKIDEITA